MFYNIQCLHFKYIFLFIYIYLLSLLVNVEKTPEKENENIFYYNSKNILIFFYFTRVNIFLPKKFRCHILNFFRSQMFIFFLTNT